MLLRVLFPLLLSFVCSLGGAQTAPSVLGSDTTARPSERYEIQQSNPARLFRPGGDSLVLVRGSVRTRQPVGSWTFRFAHYVASGESRLEDHTYRVRTHGHAHEVTGQFADGKLHGTWTHHHRRIVDSEPTETVFRSKITFDRGVPQRSFQLENENNALAGRCQRDGTAHDVWTLYINLEPAQNWHFQNGTLERIELLKEDTELPIFSPETEETTRIFLDARYVALLENWLRLSPTADVDAEPFAELIRANGAHYERTARLLRDLDPDGAFLPKIRVTVPSYPLSVEETEQLLALRTDLRQLDTLTTALLADSSLLQLAALDPAIDARREELALLRGAALAPVRELDAAFRNDVLRFLPRERFYARFDPPFSDLTAVQQTVRQSMRRVDSIQVELAGQLSSREGELLLVSLQDDLQRMFVRLDSTVNAADGKFAKRYGLLRLRELGAQQLRAYDALPVSFEKRERGRDVLNCLRDLTELTATLTELPARSAHLEGRYTDQVWNNFTATVMDARVKKHLYEAYDERLLPYFQREVRTAATCTNAARLTTQLNVVHDRMLTLRAENTDDLESTLKRTDDPQEILRLLGVPSR